MTIRDLAALDDLDLFARECVDEEEELEQDMIHRVTNRRGAFLDDENAGEDAHQMLQGTTEPGVARFLFEAEVMKDPRVATVQAAIVEERNGNAPTKQSLVLEITPINGDVLTTTAEIGS